MGKCKDCKYWKETGCVEDEVLLKEEDYTIVGFCHRWPPINFPLENPHNNPNDFLVSRKDDWCGEFQPKDSNDSND